MLKRVGWENIIENSGGGADWLKLESGKKTKIHILDDAPIQFVQHSHKTEKMKPERCKGKDCTYCLDKDNYRSRVRYAIAVFNMDEKKIQALEQGPQVFKQINAAREAYEGNLKNADIIVSKTGSGQETRYTAIPVPTTFKDEMVKDLEPLDILKLYGLQTHEVPF